VSSKYYKQEQNGRVEDCVCLPGYSGPDDDAFDCGPCVACEVGKYKASNGSSSCVDCPLHTWGDNIGLTECKSCQSFLQSAVGATENVAQTTSES
jgi:hypothetical protein